MRIGFRRHPTLGWTAVAILTAAIWAPALAQDASGPLDNLLERLQIKAPPSSPPADFVTASRPKEAPGFIPVGRTHPARTTKVMSPAEVAAAEAELDAARERQQRRAGRTPAAVPLKAPKNTAR